MKLPDKSVVEKTIKITDVGDTSLARCVLPHTNKHLHESGVYPLVSGREALSARLALITAAEKTLDLQYYIWHRDQSGHLLVSYLLEAADRGVRVRLLLDDVGSPIGDERLLLLSQHMNVSVRLFNPLGSRVRRLFSMMWDFGRTNPRMHNKSLTVDNTVTVVGGRNIGDEYFDAGSQIDFADLDLMAIGTVVEEASDGFDEYWNCDFSYPIELISHKKFSVKELRSANKKYRQGYEQHSQEECIEDFLKFNVSKQHDGHAGLRDSHAKWYWSRAKIFYDHPNKVLGDKSRKSDSLKAQLMEVSNSVSKELLLVSPYFIPGRAGMAYFRLLRSRGVKISILTNSLAATDVGAVHSGYAKYRKKLLKMGVAIYETRPDREPEEKKHKWMRKKRKIRWAFKRRGRDDKGMHIGSSSRASLHAKAFFVDRQKTFVGSMNLDPRSVLINTEIGVLVDNPEMTSEAVDDIMMSLAGSTYELSLDERNKLMWILRKEDEDVRFHSEPQATMLQKMVVWIMGRFPLESQL